MDAGLSFLPFYLFSVYLHYHVLLLFWTRSGCWAAGGCYGCRHPLQHTSKNIDWLRRLQGRLNSFARRHTTKWQPSVQRSYKHSISWMYLEATRGRPFSFVICCFVSGRHAWSEGTQYQCPNEAPGAQRGQWTRNSNFASFCCCFFMRSISTRKSKQIYWNR